MIDAVGIALQEARSANPDGKISVISHIPEQSSDEFVIAVEMQVFHVTVERNGNVSRVVLGDAQTLRADNALSKRARRKLAEHIDALG